MNKFPNLIELGLKIDDQVDTIFGEGIVTSIKPDLSYPIHAKVRGAIFTFNAIGKHDKSDKHPSLWFKSDMSWFKPPIKLPEPDHMKEFTLGRKVWVRFHNTNEWDPRIAVAYLPSAKSKFGAFANGYDQETANNIVLWDEVRYIRPEGAKNHN